MRQERRAVAAQPGPARGTGEQPHAQLAFQRTDAFGHCLLRDPQLRGRFLELPSVHDGDEGPHEFQLHGPILSARAARRGDLG